MTSSGEKSLKPNSSTCHKCQIIREF